MLDLDIICYNFQNLESWALTLEFIPSMGSEHGISNELFYVIIQTTKETNKVLTCGAIKRTTMIDPIATISTYVWSKLLNLVIFQIKSVEFKQFPPLLLKQKSIINSQREDDWSDKAFKGTIWKLPLYKWTVTWNSVYRSFKNKRSKE